MTNLENYSVCKVHSFVKNYYVPTILKNHVYDMTTGISLCGSVNMNHDRYDVEECDEVVECKACAKAFAKIKTAAAAESASWAAAEQAVEVAADPEFYKKAAAAQAASWAAAEAAESAAAEAAKTETAPNPSYLLHIISELSQAAMNLRYVEATCNNDDEYANVLTAAQCNELDNMFERLQDILKALGK